MNFNVTLLIHITELGNNSTVIWSIFGKLLSLHVIQANLYNLQYNPRIYAEKIKTNITKLKQ